MPIKISKLPDEEDTLPCDADGVDGGLEVTARLLGLQNNAEAVQLFSAYFAPSAVKPCSSF